MDILGEQSLNKKARDGKEKKKKSMIERTRDEIIQTSKIFTAAGWRDIGVSYHNIICTQIETVYKNWMLTSTTLQIIVLNLQSGPGW